MAATMAASSSTGFAGAAVTGQAEGHHTLGSWSANSTMLPDRLYADEGPEDDERGFPRPMATLDFEDRREERRRCGMLKWNIEKGVPDVGGIGWRSRTGHVLKNQAFYSSKPNENRWNNPTHAGPKTWQEFHGPRLRSDAPLMERLDRLDADQQDWEAKKAYINTVRVQTLDRLGQQRVENYQREIASQWAPHRRAKREVHSALDCAGAELDSMPMKELKKVLTPCVLKRDRDAIRAITKRVQVEETWREAWKQMERDRRDDTRAMHEQRRVYNDMLMDLSGQPLRERNGGKPLCPNQCSERVEELARPKGQRHVAASGHLMQTVDFAGLVHVQNKLALEARFPGMGHDMSTTFLEKAVDSTKAGFPPPNQPPQTPELGTQRSKARSTSMSSMMEASSSTFCRASAPVAKTRMSQSRLLPNDTVLEAYSSTQTLPTAAPPPPDQKDQLLQEPILNNPLHMTQEFPARSEHTASMSRLLSGKTRDAMDLAPPRHATIYSVVVPNAEANMERPNWRPKRPAAGSPSAASTKGRWPPCNSQAVNVRIIKATGLPNADRAGHSDPYCTVQVVGKQRSKVKTRTVQDAESPAFDEELVVMGWRKGDALVFSMFDKDIMGADDKLAMVEVPASTFYPKPFSGSLNMTNTWTVGGQRIDGELKQQNFAAKPIIHVVISVQASGDDSSAEEDEDVSAGVGSHAELTMPHTEPTMRMVCNNLDDFDAKMAPVPRLGNFWMSQGKATTRTSSTGRFIS